MKKAMILTLLFLIVPLFASAQQAPMQMQHVMPKIKVTEGETNPELIPDSAAYQLYFYAISVPTNVTQMQSDHQLGHIQKLGLTPNDHIVLLGILRDFRDRYDNLVAIFNAYATPAQARGEVVDNTLLRQQLDDLTASTRTSLKTLSGAASINIDNRVQEVKRHIKHIESVPEAQ